MGCAKAWPRWPRRPVPARPWRTRTTRPTWPPSRIAPGSCIGELELYRRNPLIHLGGLDLACYDREYAPQASVTRARLAQLAAWPQAVDAAVASLDQVSAPVATALARRGRAAWPPASRPAPTERVATAAQAAHARLVAHMRAGRRHRGSRRRAWRPRRCRR